MNYEQKYKEALSRARVVNPGTKDYNIVTTIFPELKKSDDERVRENAIQIIRYSMDGTDVALPLNIYKECIAWLEKQGEQRSDSKIEPKFKVGDFIVHNNIEGVCQVTEIKDDKYCIWPLYAEIKGYLSFIDVDNDYHLWTIRDAKDGDVLANKDGCVFIYNPSESIGSTVRSYCYLSVQGNFLLEDYNTGSWLYVNKITPATREQRDLLFQKMKEVGYKWDTELKQCNQKSTYEPKQGWSEEDESMLVCLLGTLNRVERNNYISAKNVGEYIHWLQSLKRRLNGYE